jgi:crotonobetainyl-CoA:carnitine CoA-transferase CaiB-like acyl-CoA transferase
MIQARAGFMAEELDFNEAQAQQLEDIMMAHHGEMKAAREQGRPSEATRQGHREALHRKIEAAFGSEVYQRWDELFQPGSPRNNGQGNRR